MTFVKMQHRVTTACALGLLLIASPGDAQTVAAATKEFTMTAHLQHTAQTVRPSGPAAEDTAIRSFQIRVPDAELVELQRRITATRWPERSVGPWTAR